MSKFIEVESVVNQNCKYIYIHTLINIDEISSMRYLTKEQIDELKNDYNPDDEDSVSPEMAFAQLSMTNGNIITVQGGTALKIKDIITGHHGDITNLIDDEPDVKLQ